jgi:hypothetical protein
VASLNKVRKKYNLSKTQSISSAQFREAQEMSSAKTTKRKIDTKGFTFSIVELRDGYSHIRIEGNHLSKNVIDSLPFRQKLRYKASFKIGMNNFYAMNKRKIDKFKTIREGHISFIFNSTHSRDHDNNSETIKRVQDTMVILRIIEDDKRKNITLHPDKGIEEIIIKKGEKPSIECIIEGIWE